MAATTNVDPETDVITFHKRWWVWAMILSPVCVLAVNYLQHGKTVAGDSLVAAGPRKNTAPAFNELAVAENFTSFHVPSGDHHFRIRLTKSWSGKVFIEPGHDYQIKALFADIRFHTGHEVQLRDEVALDGGISVRNGIFQLRGTGYADVWVQRRTVVR